MLVSWYAKILEHLNNAHVLYYVTNSIPPEKKMSICLFLFLKQRKRLVVLYQFILYWYDSHLPTLTENPSQLPGFRCSIFCFHCLSLSSFLSFGYCIVCLISICAIVLLFSEWDMCILSCTGSMSAVKLHWLDNILLYRVTNQDICFLVLNSCWATLRNVNSINADTIKNGANDVCFCSF